MADDTYTTLLNFVTESGQTNREIKTTTENLKKMEEQANKVGTASESMEGISFPGDELSKDFALFEKAFQKSFGRVKEDLVDFRTGTKAATGDLRKFANQSVEDLQKIAFGAENLDAGAIRELARRTGQEISEELAKGLASGNLTQEDLFEIEGIRGQVKEMEELEKAREKELATAIRASSVKSRLLNREASLLRKQAADIRENAQIIRNQAAQLQGISQVALGLGTGVVGGIFAFATKYVRDAKEATATTIAWKAAQESLTKSGEKVGAVLAQTALPLLQEAAEMAEKAAGFVEKHPEIVRAALNAGIVVAGLGAVGLAVSKGIKLYADQLYLSSVPLQLEAGKLQFAAAQEQLTAARLRAGAITKDQAIPTSVPTSGTGNVPGIGNVLGTLGKVVLTASSVIIGAELGLALGNAIAKLIDPSAKDMTGKETLFYGGVRAVEALEQKWFAFLGKAGDKLPDILGGKTLRLLSELGGSNIQKVDKFFQKLLLGADQLGKAADELGGGVKASPQFEQILKAYEDYKRDDLALVQKHYAEREKIISDSLSAELAENARYAADVNRVNANTAKSIGDATRSYEQESIKAEQEYAQQRAQIIRDGGIEIQRMEEDLQERLRQLREEHEDRLEGLVADRDALGIVKEQQRYSKERDEEIRQTNREIQQRRADLALRLQDLEQSYIQERAQRFADYQARIEEIRRNAAEQLAELAARHREELIQIRQQKADRLKELDNQFQEERRRRYEYFIDQIRNLDASLLGEAELRKRRQAEMIVELDKFLIAYKTKMGTLLTPPASPGRVGGGYATYGTYLLGDRSGGGRGKPEYVLRGDVTELAERVLGGRLSQEKMVALLNASGRGGGSSVTYNDGRRIDSRISNTDRQRLVDDTMEALERSLR